MHSLALLHEKQEQGQTFSVRVNQTLFIKQLLYTGSATQRASHQTKPTQNRKATNKQTKLEKHLKGLNQQVQFDLKGIT